MKKYARKEKDDKQKEYVDSSDNALQNIKNRKRDPIHVQTCESARCVRVRAYARGERLIKRESAFMMIKNSRVNEKAAHFEYENSPKLKTHSRTIWMDSFPVSSRTNHRHRRILFLPSFR